jgi:aspartokinase
LSVSLCVLLCASAEEFKILPCRCNYTANPNWLDAKKIESLSYSEANEMANFGATILNAKTIIPLLEKNIPLRILNTFNHENNGTHYFKF